MSRRVAEPALLGVLLLAAVALVGLPAPGGATLPQAPAVAVGCGAGLLLFRALAPSWPRARLRLTGTLPALRHGAALTARAALEEIGWRGYVLALLAPVASPGGALALSSCLFALAHTGVRGRRRLVHVVTGGVFGGVYLGTGRLAAAVAAHAVYNGLIAVALTSAPRPGAKAALAPAVASLARRAPAAARDDRAAPLDAVGVERRFGDHVALAGVDLRLERGEILALLGPNGAGKTTLVAILLGLRRPDAGTVRLFGLDPRLPAARARVGALLQEPAFPPTLRVGELAALVAAHFPAPLAVAELLGRFGLASLAHVQAGALSGGQRRRLALALAFAGRPQAVFLDEPTAGLDVESRRALWDVVRAQATGGGSVLLTTHHLDEAEALATRVAIIDRGAIVAGGTVDELRRRAGVSRVTLRAARQPRLDSAIRVEHAGETLTVHTRDVPALVAELAAAGVGLEELEVSPLRLEEVFLALVEPGEGAARS